MAPPRLGNLRGDAPGVIPPNSAYLHSRSIMRHLLRSTPRRGTAAVLAAFALSACATVTPADGALTVADRLYLGGASPSGPISEPEWERFVAEVVTPLFPNGLTLWRARGQWREVDGRITREEVLIIEVLHSGGAQQDARLDQIALAYRQRFSQEAVLRSTARVNARFVR